MTKTMSKLHMMTKNAKYNTVKWVTKARRGKPLAETMEHRIRIMNRLLEEE